MAEPQRQTDEDSSVRNAAERPDLRALEGGNQGGEGPAGYQKPQAAPQRDPYDKSSAGSPITKPDLRALEGGNQGGEGPAGYQKPQAAPTESGSSRSSSPSTSTKSSKGTLNASGAAGGNDSLFNAGGDQGALGKLGGFFGKGKGRLKKSLKNKWLLSSVAITSASSVAIVLFLVVFLGSLKLPDVMQHIETYEFARTTRQFSQSAERVTEEALQVDAATEGTAAEGASASDPGGFYGQLKNTYGDLKANVNDTYQSVRENTWGKFDQFRPGKVIEKLGVNDNLALNFRTSSLTGREIFTGGSIGSQTFSVEPLTGFAKWTPGLRTIIKTKNLAQFYSEFLPAVSSAEQANNTALLVRGAVELDIVKATGGSTAGWVLSKFTNSNQQKQTSPTAADAQNEAEVIGEMYDSTQAGFTAADNASTGELQQADTAANQSEQSDVQKLENGGFDYNSFLDYHLGDAVLDDNSDPYASYVQSIIDDNAGQAADAALTPSLTQTVEADANPLSGVAIPLCIIYDGSVQKSGPSMTNQINQQENTFTTLATEADEQEAGGPSGNTDSGSLASAIGATNAQLGDISQSYPEILANGGTIDTSATPSAEAGSDGGYNYSIFNALGLSPTSFEGKVVNAVVGNTCGVLTNSYVLAGGAIVSVGQAILTLGTANAAEDAAGQTARSVVKDFANNLASNVAKQLTKKVVVRDGVKVIERGALSRFERFVFKQGLIVGGTVGTTELAHMIVASRSGIANNGVAQGTSLVNEATCGANIQAGENERHGLFGRPLTQSEITQAQAADDQFISYQNSSKSFSQRYFSPNNADSLTSHIALAVDSETHSGILATLFNLAAEILRPMNLFGSLVATLDGSALAAPNPSTQDCGNVQFGWSQAEENLIDSNQSYRPLPNAKVLSDSNEGPAIAQEYAKCFGYSSDPSSGELVSDIAGAGSLGTLLANDDIERDSNGNVIEGTPPTSQPTGPYAGDCSPSSLGVDNNAYGPQMVFRWRLGQQYELTLDRLLDAQTTTSSTTTPSSGAGTGTSTPPASGNAAQLAKQILSNKNIDLSSFSSSVLQDVQDAAAGKPGTAGAMTSSAILQLIATIGQTHKVLITAIQSDGQGHCNGVPKSGCPDDPHYNGDAVDFGSLDGVTITGRNAPAITIMQQSFSLLPSGSGFGQSECGLQYSTDFDLPNKDITFNDTCNHLHVQVPKGTP